ncbi:sulfatase-like hydrolase/transferase, partial [candidate division KSB1 bacterium]
NRLCDGVNLLPYLSGEGTDPNICGLPVNEITIGDLLKKSGYRTAVVGKWHLGTKKQFHPCSRGFDEFFGMLEGSSTYLPGKAKRIKRNFEQANYKKLPYLTDAFGDEACYFIKRNKNNPFYLYLSFNAPHTPLHARPDYLEKFRAEFKTEERAINAAMTKSLDENVGKVLQKLKELDLEEDTLIFFTNDNGGALPYNASNNDPLSGTKGTFLEGGIRVPFLVQWKGVLPEGKVYGSPVTALDIFPTAIAAAGGKLPENRIYDGVNLLPYLSGEKSDQPHDILFWRLLHHGAVRKGDWKLIWFDDEPPRLHNLAEDISEKNDLSNTNPEKTKELLGDFYIWEKQMKNPLWITAPKWKQHSRMRYNQNYVETLKKRLP